MATVSAQELRRGQESVRFGPGGGTYRIVTTSQETAGRHFGFEATEPPGGGPPLDTATPPARQLTPPHGQFTSCSPSWSLQLPWLDANRSETTTVSSSAPARKAAATPVRK